MKTIYKYKITPYVEEYDLPLNAEILTVQVQIEDVCIWAIVDSEETIRQCRRIKIYGTGHEMTDEKHKYIGTFQMNGGVGIFHVFEII